MRTRVAAAMAAAALAMVAGPVTAGASSAATADRSRRLPAGAGHLVQGPRDILWPASHHAPAAAQGHANRGEQQLTYHGGLRHAGGVIHHPAVYLVFWGSQWQRNDPYATYEQRFFRGLYGPGDNWTGLQREWCDGVPKDAVDCPGTAAHVGAPDGVLVKGVWFDNNVFAIPTDLPFVRGLTPDAVAQEAVRAAAHFGNNSPAKNRNVQYIINEPSRFDSLGYGLYCGYHSYVTSNYGSLPYIDLPYVTDLGFDCGQNAVNTGSAGTYDGVSIVGGHEFIEVLTDPYVDTGWMGSDGQENADKCQWRTTEPGALTDLHLSTGTFAIQGAWSNLANNGDGQCRNHTGR